jgi:hypothetical protein
MSWTGHISCREEIRNAYKVLIGKLEGKCLFGRPRHRLEDILK